MFTKLKNKLKRAIAFVLTVSMVSTSVQVPTMAAGVETSNYLDGWNVQVAWNNLTTDYTWNAERDEFRQPKIVVSYRMENAQHDYPAGALSITVPGIGNAVRGTLRKADELAADKQNSEWNYVWDESTDAYTFRNKFEVKEGQSVSGGFELLWDAQARDWQHGYSQTMYPSFAIEGAGAITLPALSFHYTSQKDEYTLAMRQAKVSPGEYGDLSKDYIWYNLTTTIRRTKKARGLYRSSYFVKLDLQGEGLASDVIIESNDKVIPIITNEKGETGFYLFTDKTGSLVNYYEYEEYPFRIGLKKEVYDGTTLGIDGRLETLYEDEEAWTPLEDCSGVHFDLKVENYGFNYTGHVYEHRLHGDYQYRTYDKDEPEEYTDRLNAVNLYADKTIELHAYGRATAGYTSKAAAMRRQQAAGFLPVATPSEPDCLATPSEVEKEDGLILDEEFLNEEISEEIDLFGAPTYGELYPAQCEPMGDFEFYGEELVGPHILDGKDGTDAETGAEQDTHDKAPVKPDFTEEKEEVETLPPETEAGQDVEIASPSTAKKPAILSLRSPKRSVRRVSRIASGSNAPQDMDDTAGIIEEELGIAEDEEEERYIQGRIIGEGEIYSLVLGEDKFAIHQNDGTLRDLTAEEYDISHVEVTANDGKPYQIFGATDVDASFDEYVLLKEDVADKTKTTRLPEGVKAFFVRMNELEGNETFYVDFGLRLHLDWEAEQALPEGERVNHEDRLVAFSFMRSIYTDEEGNERNDLRSNGSVYEGEYGKQLAERDLALYGEGLFRDYTNVWLRSPVTELSTDADVLSITGDPQNGFTFRGRLKGDLKADSEGSLKKFSLYAVLPNGYRLDTYDPQLNASGSGTYLGGESVSDFRNYVAISTRKMGDNTVVIVDADFTDSPLDIQKNTSISLNLEATMSYADFIEYGNTQYLRGYLVAHDGGLDKISGTSIVVDNEDIDEDGNVTELISYTSELVQVRDTANEWREYIAKYVSSAYTDGVTMDTVARLYNEADTEDFKEKSNYSYRLDFGLGASNAKNIVFYDHIEQGATIAGGDGNDETITSEWQGALTSVDVSKIVEIGGKPTIYYSEDERQAFDLAAAGWSTTAPADLGQVKSIAVHVDTSAMSDGLMKIGQYAYVVLRMRAPSDRGLIEKKAVNQYYVEYDGYGLTNNFEKRYNLSSAETSVKLLDNVGQIYLESVDADTVIKENADGTVQYQPLLGVMIQVYDAKGTPIFEEEGRSVNSVGKILIDKVRQGDYTYEVVSLPEGYENRDGKAAFKIDGINGTVLIKNYRIPGTLTLTLNDQDNAAYGPLKGGTYEVYTSEGELVHFDENGTYTKDGTVSVIETDENGQFTVTGLPWGNYYVVQVGAPDGYEASTLKMNFQIGREQYDKETNTISTEIKAYNSEKIAQILLTKTDSEDGRPVRNATFSIFKETAGEDQLITKGLKTNAVGEVLVEGLKFGSYYFVETRNAGGYLMPDNAHAKTEPVTLDASTAEQTLRISMENDRAEGSVVLTKKDDAGQLVGGAVYGLWYKPEGTDSFSKLGSYTTDADRQSDTYGELRAENLKWGEYYFLEEKAPEGYELSKEQAKFTIDRESVQNTVYLDVVDNRLTGSVKLVKVDKANHDKKLAGAVYELYRTDGTKCIAGVDYTLPAGVAEIRTGTDGSITLSGIKQGGYYFKESVAPTSYSLSDELVRFSVTKENAAVQQEILAEDEAGKAVITINKKANDIHSAFGNPTFVFKVTRDDGAVYKKSVTLSKENPESALTFTVEQGHTYRIEEESSSRYYTGKVVAGANAKVEGTTAVVDLTAAAGAEVSFENVVEQYEKFSQVSNSTNIVEASTKLTGISVEYTGPNPITKDLPGYDTVEELYTIPKSDLLVTAFYDDGTSVVLDEGDFTIDPEYADGSSDSFTGTVTYKEGGTKRTSSYQFDVELPTPTPKHTVTFELDGGTIIPDGGTSAQATLTMQVKEGRAIEKPQNDPVKEGSLFKGWFTDKACTVEAVFPLTVGKTDTTIYAKWEQEVTVKYAVSIYGIMQDVDDKGQTVGLTFGPATGASYISTYKDHVPSAGQMCMHSMSWEEIIAQSQKNPHVFRECLENGCTHSVELTITGKLAEGATSYPNMTGDGAGVLYDSIHLYYRSWNRRNSTYFDTSSDEYRNGTNKGGWPDSAVRNTLNGTVTDNMLNITNKDNGFAEAKLDENTALISCFPKVLKDAIVPKAVKSDTVYNDVSGNNVVTYDKLWLLSGAEAYMPGSNNKAIRPNEGTPYERTNVLSITTSDYAENKAYSESDTTDIRWLRSATANNGYQVYSVYYSGSFSGGDTMYLHGLSPCFCLPGPKPDVKYAVSVYGIMHDDYMTENGEAGKAGLTFGPATGKNYVNTFKSHTPTGNTASGNAHRCIHNDDWEVIISWSQKDPYVYEQCIDGGGSGESCTKAVPLYLNGKLKGTSYPNMSGDGAGTLYNSITTDYRKWNWENSTYFDASTNEYKYGTNKGGWPDSAVRNTLNGIVTDNMLNITNKDNGFVEAKLDKNTALISCFPTVLKDAIVPKAVKSDTVFNDISGNNAVTYDKLWLLSGAEAYVDSGSKNDVIRPNEGAPYERVTALDITTSSYSMNKGYRESGSTYYRWLRSAYRGVAHYAHGVGGSGVLGYGSANGASSGLAPGFCLPGPKPDVKYAVSVYGIKHDTYKDENGNTGTAGLTFGPATGKSYVDTFKAHTPAGNTSSGNPHRCVHNDDWATIASWSQKDPYVYEQCIDGGGSGESCTKAVPLYLNGKLKGTSYPDMSGDGAGMLYTSIISDYWKWNRPRSTYFDYSSLDYQYGTNKGGWPDSAVRNTLNGIVTDNMLNITNKDNGFAEAKLDENTALISCFPTVLRDAIVPKAVKSDTERHDISGNNVVTYDKLWLLSVAEAYVDQGIRPNEGTSYERTVAFGIKNGIGSDANICYDDRNIAFLRWLRSISSSQYHVYGVYNNGIISEPGAGQGFGLAPGFCLK